MQSLKSTHKKFACDKNECFSAEKENEVQFLFCLAEVTGRFLTIILSQFQLVDNSVFVTDWV